MEARKCKNPWISNGFWCLLRLTAGCSTIELSGKVGKQFHPRGHRFPFGTVFIEDAQPARKSVLDRALSVFADVRAGEGATAILMLVNIFLLLICYSVIKTVREPLILLGGGAEMRSYASAGQALLLINDGLNNGPAPTPTTATLADSIIAAHLNNNVFPATTGSPKYTLVLPAIVTRIRFTFNRCSRSILD